MAPSHKAETVNQILTNHKKLFTISRDHFHCSPHATQRAISNGEGSCLSVDPPRRAKQKRNGKNCSLFIGYHGEAELVGYKLDFLNKSKRFEFSYELLKSLK